MKLVTFEAKNGERHIGAVAGDAIVDFTASDPSPHFRDMLALIDGGEAALDRARFAQRRITAVDQRQHVAEMPRGG